MRTPEEMFELILRVAREDDRIRAVSMSGSRANRDCPADVYQDYDITYYVTEVAPFRDNDAWIAEHFGEPALMQKPESMGLIPPDNNGDFPYLMIFPDGNRIDLCFTARTRAVPGEPEVALMDRDGILADAVADETHWYVKRPTEKHFSDCCNEFHWCLNNVAKGIARDEISYTMDMLECNVRGMLLVMLGWYAGMKHDFRVSVGKHGKYLRKFLPEELYLRFRDSYGGADTASMWKSAFDVLDIFGEVAREVAAGLGFRYNEAEEDAIRDYMEKVRRGLK